ncbi:MAG: ExbD/TolR family protein [Candidatus Aminicenantales bacterium]
MAISIGGPEKVKSEPNVVPLCDVLLVLLIIFMVVTPLVQKGVDVRLPPALNTINMPDNPEVVLAIRKDGTMFVNQDQATMENLQILIEEAFLTASDKKLYVKIDSDVEYGKLVEPGGVFDVLKEAGVEDIGIITEVKTEKST